MSPPEESRIPRSFLLVYVTHFKGLVFVCMCLSVSAYTFAGMCVGIDVLLCVYFSCAYGCACVYLCVGMHMCG